MGDLGRWPALGAKYGLQLRAILLGERVTRLLRRKPAGERVYLELALTG